MLKNTIKISEIFESIQGEGHYTGYPMLFIRTFGCTRDCDFCDTNYSKFGEFKEINTDELVEIIKESKLNRICWTGGEPLLQREQIYEIIKETREKKHHLESNGDLLTADNEEFDYITVSPKDLKTADRIHKLSFVVDEIKVVTDLDKIGLELVPFATILMPLTTYQKKKDLEICRKVWQYCVEHKVRFSPRLQYFIWGKKRKV